MIEPPTSQGPGRTVLSAPCRFIGQNVDIKLSPKSESAHQPRVLQVQPPAALHGTGQVELVFRGALTQHDRVAQTVGHSGEIDRRLAGAVVEPGGPADVGKHPVLCGQDAELIGKYMKTPAIAR